MDVVPISNSNEGLPPVMGKKPLSQKSNIFAINYLRWTQCSPFNTILHYIF